MAGSHATGQKRPANVRVLARVLVRELMAGSGAWKALFPWKGDKARNYGFAFIGSRRGIRREDEEEEGDCGDRVV